MHKQTPQSFIIIIILYACIYKYFKSKHSKNKMHDLSKTVQVSKTMLHRKIRFSFLPLRKINVIQDIFSENKFWYNTMD